MSLSEDPLYCLLNGKAPGYYSIIVLAGNIWLFSQISWETERAVQVLSLCEQLKTAILRTVYIQCQSTPGRSEPIVHPLSVASTVLHSNNRAEI